VSARSLPQPHNIARWVRYACYAVVIVLLWQFLSNFSFVRITEGDNSVNGVTGRRTIVLKLYGDDEDPERGQAVVFAMADENDQPYRRAARVAGVPGDRITRGERFIEVNGEPTPFPASEIGRLEGTIPDGMYLLLNDNPYSTFPDSRRTGLIPRAVILGRLLCEAPF
jgi:signal peptidase I